MYVFIDKIIKQVYISYSKKVITKESGINYHTLTYYLRKGSYYETESIIFLKRELLKSQQGGLRIKGEN
jgi:hypothetical protein